MMTTAALAGPGQRRATSEPEKLAMAEQNERDESINSLETPREGSKLVRVEEEKQKAFDDELERQRDALAAEGRKSAQQVRTELELWIARRLQLCDKERRLLGELRSQVGHAAEQKSADAVARYLAQAVHIRSEILKLRDEPNDLTISSAP